MVNKNKVMTETQFIESKGDYFHLRLLKYVTTLDEMSEGNELDEIKEKNLPLFFDFDEGKYSIKWEDLTIKAVQDLDDFKEDFPSLDFDNSEYNKL